MNFHNKYELESYFKGLKDGVSRNSGSRTTMDQIENEKKLALCKLQSRLLLRRYVVDIQTKGGNKKFDTCIYHIDRLLPVTIFDEKDLSVCELSRLIGEHIVSDFLEDKHK